MPLALWCLLAAALLHLVSKMPLALAMAREGRGYDNHNPRDQQARLTGWGRRAKAIHDNQIESFPLFAAGVLAAMVSAPGSAAVGLCAAAYVVARVVYMLLYLADQATLRSAVWSVGFIASLALIAAPLWAR